MYGHSYKSLEFYSVKRRHFHSLPRSEENSRACREVKTDNTNFSKYNLNYFFFFLRHPCIPGMLAKRLQWVGKSINKVAQKVDESVHLH